MVGGWIVSWIASRMGGVEKDGKVHGGPDMKTAGLGVDRGVAGAGGGRRVSW